MNRRISIENYEAFLLDYLEGMLEPDVTAKLMFFLSQHPEIEVTDEMPENCYLSSNNDLQINPGNLIKSLSDIKNINEKNYEEFLIAKIENDISPFDEKRINAYINEHPAARADLEIYRKTRLIDDKSVTCPLKAELKKPVTPFLKRRRIIYISIAAAASIASLFFFKGPYDRPEVSPDRENISKEQQIPSQKSPAENKQAFDTGSSGTKSKTHLSASKKLQNSGQNSQKQQLPSAAFEESLSPANRGDIPERLQIIIRPLPNDHIQKMTLLAGQSGSVTSSPQQDGRPSSTNLISGIQSLIGVEINKSPDKSTLWLAFEYSIKGINNLTESEIRVYKETDREGITHTSIRSENFSFSSQSNK